MTNAPLTPALRAALLQDLRMPEGNSGDLMAVYAWLNDRYFKGELIQPCSITFDYRIKGDPGVTSYGFTAPLASLRIEDLSPDIRLSPATAHHRALLADTLLHEMIRLWQVQCFSLSSDFAYLDIGRDHCPALFPGIGQVFQNMARHLNAHYPELSVSDEIPVEDYLSPAEADMEIYVLGLHGHKRNDASCEADIGFIVQHKHLVEPGTIIYSVVDSLEVAHPEWIISEATIFKTKNTAAYRLPTLDEHGKPNNNDLTDDFTSMGEHCNLVPLLESAISIRSFNATRREAPSSIRPDGMLL